MSAATVVVSSAEGAGDMPSSVPVGGGDSSTEGAPPFSEVLSRSSSDQPDVSDTSNASSPALPSPDSGEAGAQIGTVPTALPVSSKSGAGAADPSREPVQGRATPSKPGVAPFPRPPGSPPPSRTDAGDRTPPPVCAPTQAAGAATDAAGSPSVAASSTEAPSTSPASELPATLTAVTASTPSEGSPVAAGHAGPAAAAGGLSTPAFVTTWATNRPHSFEAGTADEDVHRGAGFRRRERGRAHRSAGFSRSGGRSRLCRAARRTAPPRGERVDADRERVGGQCLRRRCRQHGVFPVHLCLGAGRLRRGRVSRCRGGDRIVRPRHR